MAKKKKSQNLREFLIKRFLGLHLGGSKTDNTTAAVFEFYPKHKKVFLSRIHAGLGPQKDKTSDQILHELITVAESPVDKLAIDAPLTLPKCMRCELKCPGFEKCSEVEIKWMWSWYRKHGKLKKPQRTFIPYTQRCVDLYASTDFDKPFHPSEALGSNMAPLTARTRYITRRLDLPVIEVYPTLALWRIGQRLEISKTLLNFHRHSVDGENHRHQIVRRIMDSGLAFIYEQDIRVLSTNPAAFDAFICGLTAYIDEIGGCEKRPAGFPKKEGWLSIPMESFIF